MAQPPPPPCVFYGYVYAGGKPARDGLNVTAVIGGTTLSWTTETRNGTYGWPVKGSSSFMIPSDDPETPEKDGGVTGDSIEFYVQGIKINQTATFECGDAKKFDLSIPETPPYVVIDQAFTSVERVDVGSIQTIGFHAKWDNGSDVIGGSIYVYNVEYVPNGTGWINVNVSSFIIGKKDWIVTGVNCSGITTYMQTAPNPSIIWDEIIIVDGGFTNESILLGETVTVWFKALYEYDSVIFDDIRGTLYVNDSAMVWSTTNNRWEYYYAAITLGSKAFKITGFSDSRYNLTAINDQAGVQTITFCGSPALTSSLDTSTTYIGFKVEISGKLVYNDTGLPGSNLLLSYSVTEGKTWNDITSVITITDGSYYVEWMPTATGNYLVRVKWDGNETLYIRGSEALSTLAVTPLEEKYVFSVISNSTVSELTFNSTSRILGFTVTGSLGTTGYTKVTIAKELIGNIAELKVYLDEAEINYTVSSAYDSWVIHFTHQHSIHKVDISLGPPPSKLFIETPLGIATISGGIIAITIGTIFIILRRRKTRQLVLK
jgi:hypothetical protein